MPISVDLSSKESFSIIKRSINKWGNGLDYIVNNAAFYDLVDGYRENFKNESYDIWEKVFRVNLMAPFFLVQSLEPILQKSQCPSIVNISSMMGVIAPTLSLYKKINMKNPNPASYAVTKAGMIQLSKWLSIFLGPKIRVNSVSPGGILRDQDKDFVKRYNEIVPLGRMGNENEIAEAVSFLLSTKASYITGHNLMVDGGWTSK